MIVIIYYTQRIYIAGNITIGVVSAFLIYCQGMCWQFWKLSMVIGTSLGLTGAAE